MIKGMINYTQMLWFKVTNDDMTMTELLLVAAMLFGIGFSIASIAH